MKKIEREREREREREFHINLATPMLHILLRHLLLLYLNK